IRNSSRSSSCSMLGPRRLPSDMPEATKTWKEKIHSVGRAVLELEGVGAVPGAGGPTGLAEGGRKAMLATKRKAIAGALAAVLLGASAAGALAPPNDPPAPPRRKEKEPAPEEKGVVIPAARQLTGPQGFVTQLAVSPDGRLVAAGGAGERHF